MPLRERVEALPGMRSLLPALEGLDPAYLVGGAVRDLLLGGPSVDLDVAVEGDAVAVAEEVAARLGGSAKTHDRFGTATVRTRDMTVDLASTRSETYERPGALPEVAPAGLDEDLGRRDFTINAMAIALTGAQAGELRDPHGGAADLEARTVRVLHDASFADDPTRLLRAVRYEARLAFTIDRETERLARACAEGLARACAEGLASVSGARVRDELLDLLAEDEAPAAVDRMRALGIAAALHPSIRADGSLITAAQLGSMETGADRVLSALAALASDGATDLVERLDLGAAERDRVLRAAERGRSLAHELPAPRRPSELHELLSPEPPEALALALAFGAPAEAVLSFVAGIRDARLDIGGDDLRAEGVPESPAIGEALAETLRRKLDGEIFTREEQLRTAVAIARRAS